MMKIKCDVNLLNKQLLSDQPLPLTCSHWLGKREWITVHRDDKVSFKDFAAQNHTFILLVLEAERVAKT